MQVGTGGPDHAMRRPAVDEVGMRGEVPVRVDVVIARRDDVAEDRDASQRLIEFGHLGAAGDGERSAFAEVVLHVHDDGRCLFDHAVTLARFQAGGTSRVGIAGSPRESLSPSHGRLINALRRCSRDASRSGRSSTGEPARISGRCSGRVRRRRRRFPGAATTISSIAVPLGLCARNARLRPPCVALCSDRFATGRPSTSTSL